MRQAALQGPAGLTVRTESATWGVTGAIRHEVRAVLLQPVSGLIVTHAAGPAGSTWTLEARDLPSGPLLDVRRLGRPPLEGGTVRGSAHLTMSAAVAAFDLDLSARSARLPALTGDASEPQSLGEPTDLALRAIGSWRRTEGALDVPRWSA